MSDNGDRRPPLRARHFAELNPALREDTKPCPVCLEREATRELCKPCRQSLSRVYSRTIDTIIWAADRARRFERARQQKNKERST